MPAIIQKGEKWIVRVFKGDDVKEWEYKTKEEAQKKVDELLSKKYKAKPKLTI